MPGHSTTAISTLPTTIQNRPRRTSARGPTRGSTRSETQAPAVHEKVAAVTESPATVRLVPCTSWKAYGTKKSTPKNAKVWKARIAIVTGRPGLQSEGCRRGASAT